VFAIPYEGAFTLIGTTDIDYAGEPGAPSATPEEIEYLCRLVGSYFKTPVTPAQVVRTFSGVRPLYDDGASKAKDATRDYVLALDAPQGGAPLVTIYGGKITTYRKLAAAALAKLAPHLPMGAAWTDAAPLPGGDFAWDGLDDMIAQARRRWPFLSEPHAARLVRAHGARIERVLGDVRNADAVGPIFGGLITAAEIAYFKRCEWASEPSDVLWRRSKLGLHLGAADIAALSDFMAQGGGRRAAG
jgi:glycerol-3-phosphate dehydrogenase